MECQNNLKQLALGLQNCADTQAGGKAFPAGTIANSELPPEKRLSWVVNIVPYLESENWSQKVDRTAAWDSPGNAAVMPKEMKLFSCPDVVREYDQEAGTQEYRQNNLNTGLVC